MDNINDTTIWKKGYKGFKNNLTANNDFQFEIGKTYHHSGQPIELCAHGFHFCTDFIDVITYYDIGYNNRYRYCEIEYDSRDGKVIHGEGNYKGKSVTSSIRIVRELIEEEIRELLKEQSYEVWRDEETKEFHNEGDRPAFISYHDNNGIVKCEQWWINGEIHREGDRPAIIKYYDNNGNVQYEQWWNNGKCHREGDRPALIKYYDKNGVIGDVKLEQWCSNGKLHREGDRPALIIYNINGNIKEEEWYFNGEYHREGDRPDRICYDDNNGVIGNVKEE